MQTLIGPAPNMSPTRSRTQYLSQRSSPIPAPSTSQNKTHIGGILVVLGFLGARALGAYAWALGRPGGPPGRVGSCPGRFGLRLGTVLAYRWRSIQNRAQTVKAKMHIWQNPMEPYLNMNPSSTMIHITSRYP